ncbi:g patch domain containing [Stylonychia lemnae]|uniref:G patch domain containing n=1 Tax=Stylonychia lemnae TaxID=5949 RepID=A0A078AI79_STYLE|nr:g patch domain containing [Stylonychia lemnae]|eukprot:CDW81217.1 g patch domain containing [Stylonychia lemnae]
MSRKYFDKLMTGSGVTGRQVKSKLGENIMKMMGWDHGKGLGKHEKGETEVIQIKRREEGMGLGVENTSPAVTFRWSDQFWVDVYNKAATSFQNVKQSKEKKKSSKKRDESSDSDSSSDGEFDGNIVIQKSKKSLSSKIIKKESKQNAKDKVADKKADKKQKDKKKDKKDKKKSVTPLRRSRRNSTVSDKK